MSPYKYLWILAGVGVVLMTGYAHGAAQSTSGNWPQWRGPTGNGVAAESNPPLQWSETNQVKWKVRLPGKGTSTPAVWGNKVFVLAAAPVEAKAESAKESKPAPVPEAAPGDRPRRGGGGGRNEKPDQLYRFYVYCLDRQTGKVLWEKVATEAIPHEGHHQDHGYASASPVTDGEHLLAYFGSRGLHCYDLQGNELWKQEFGKMQTRNGFGEGSSPVLSGNTVIVNWDHEGEDFIIALDKRTGKTLWKKDRQEPTGWSTPLVVEHAGKKQVVVNATTKVRSYDVATGEELWQSSGQTANAIPSPVAANGVVYVMSGFRGSLVQAIRLGRTGDLMGTDAIAWSHNKSTPYVPSPLLYGDLLYFFANNDAKISCFDVKTGKANYEAERLEGIFGVYASPVGANERVYVTGRDGNFLVLKSGPKLEILARNKLEDKFDATPALAGNQMFLRGHENLYCIGQ